MKINIKNTMKILSEITIIEKGCHARTITAIDIEAAIKNIEKTLSGMLHKKDWFGVKFLVDRNAQSFPSSYHGVPESTQVIVERFPSGWFVTGIKRDTCKGTEIHPIFDPKTKANAFVDYFSNSRSWN